MCLSAAALRLLALAAAMPSLGSAPFPPTFSVDVGGGALDEGLGLLGREAGHLADVSSGCECAITGAGNDEGAQA